MKHKNTFLVVDENDTPVGLYLTDEGEDEAKATLEGVAKKMSWEQREADFDMMAWVRS